MPRSAPRSLSQRVRDFLAAANADKLVLTPIEYQSQSEDENSARLFGKHYFFEKEQC